MMQQDYHSTLFLGRTLEKNVDTTLRLKNGMWKRNWEVQMEICFRLILEGVLTAHTDGCWVWDCCIAVPPNSTGMWGRGWLRVMGSRSSVVRALAAQASNLGSIPSDFPVSFPHSIFQPECSVNIFTRLHRTILFILLVHLVIIVNCSRPQTLP